ncbi:uncharacterized protein LOC125659921 isoform X2 [Ostrea edulis]|uniref:uncharacterized protein LOC125659921 isoform X2 n=1 Tax=Ostrea edulis TaxID=37623 RepID=UPI0024AF091F|nr:uncharacterized protein LOC125659921 isoform X2 [Ostrea edulis]
MNKLQRNMKKVVPGVLITLLAMFLLGNSTSEAAPLSTTEKPARWTNPCNATRDLSSRNFTVPFLPEFEKIQRISEKLLTVMDITVTLKTKIANERVQSSIMTSALNSQHIDGFPNTTLSQHNMEEYKDNVTLAYIRSYRDLSVVAVFLEAVREDEDQYEYGSWTPEIKDKENRLYGLLCELHNAIITNGAVIEYESRDIMPQEWRGMSNRSYRNYRDYVIMKDSGLVYQSFFNMYQTILNSFKVGV